MTHQPIFSGSGHYCPACACSWDQGEEPPETCDAYTFSAEEIDPSFTVVGFAGNKGSGKDTAAAVLIERGFAHIKMAGAIKAMLRALLAYRGVPEAMIERYVEGDLKEEPCPALNGQTMRHAMQSLGTGWGRQMMHRDIWVDATRDQVCQHPRAVISDLRFHNEVEMVHELGGKVIRIDRPGAVGDNHSSETHIASLAADIVVSNRYDTAEQFQGKISSLLPEGY